MCSYAIAHCTFSPCSAETDFTGIDEFVFFPTLDNMLRRCINISITDDNETESNEQFLVQFTGSASLPPNVRVGRMNATITIRDRGK